VWRRPGDKLILVAILALAAALRLIDLPGRGEWDDDQGAELLAMLTWVRDGQVPLLGPLSSNLTVHHGAGFYWILAPSAFLTDVSPVAAVFTLALVGIAGVAAAWWLGRTVGGPAAGHITGLLMAVSPSAITESTFVWNANIVAPGAALASAAAWHAWRTRHARWWLFSAAGALLMLNGHLLAAIAIPSFIALVAADVLRRPRSEWARMLLSILGAVATIAAGYLPVLLYDLHTGFSQYHAIKEFLAAPHGPDDDLPPGPMRLRNISWRLLAWPVSGFAQSAPYSGLAAAVITGAAPVAAAIVGRGITRQFAIWAFVTTVWAVLALSFIAPSLAAAVAGLPTDQYHTWLDPILFAVIGALAARLWTLGSALVPKIASATIAAGCIALSLWAAPPLASPDGGWPTAERTAARIRSITADKPIAVIGVVKTGAALGFPLSRQRSQIVQPTSAEFLVITCDPLFFGAVVTPCGGPAEDARARDVGFPTARVVDRFADGPRRIVSVFASH
jgi:4-amino-4-deoxy-L-arabinose transferase-like glycosyltransferase